MFRRVLTNEGYRQLCRFLNRRDRGCILCGCPVVDHHHVIARSLGGDDSADNMVCLCRWHHQQYDKDKAMKQEFLAYLEDQREYHEAHAEELEAIYRIMRKRGDRHGGKQKTNQS